MFFLVVLPVLIAWFEARWNLRIDASEWRGPGFAVGLILLVAASALGIWAAIAMSTRGDGTPLPSATARRLVIAGPYRNVRNPMALAGIVQAVGVGLMLGSWLVVLYGVCGAAYWNWLVRPIEEADLETRFGESFRAYRDRVRCWLPGPGPRPVRAR
ncbi:methyltransferase family protein [Leucobacter soli]|uniref:methyltransferase family protein n=1 Tax=Leucobacter soli TaxID=2812850 RepID=UPI003613EB18